MESTLSSPCSRCNPPLSRQDAGLAHFDSLPPYDLMLWTDALFLFFLAKAALAYLPTAHFVAPGPVSPFQRAHKAKVCPLKPAPFCKLSGGLGSTNKSATSLLPFASRLSFFLLQSLWQKLSLLYCSIKLQWVPGHSFLPRNDAADELTRQEALSLHSGSPCSLSPLISRIHSSLFSDWRRTVSSKFFAHGFPRFRPRNLCSIVTRAVCSLVFAATAIAFC